jgi:tetratricopeptide (TPR) repeat protein
MPISETSVHSALHQRILDIYACFVVGLVGNALIGWELGTKGWVNLGLEGPRNKRVTLSLFCFMIMIVWQGATKMQASCFLSWKGLWMPLVGVVAFSIARLLKPKSLRLYDRAKLLHERTYAGDWRMKRPDDLIASVRGSDSLNRAELLYHDALVVQERLAASAQTKALKKKYLLNVAAVYTQLALLSLQKGLPDLAGGWAGKAVFVSQSIVDENPGDPASLRSLSYALFRLGLADEAAQRYESSRSNLNRSLAIDTQLGDQSGIEVTQRLLDDMSRRI